MAPWDALELDAELTIDGHESDLLDQAADQLERLAAVLRIAQRLFKALDAFPVDPREIRADTGEFIEQPAKTYSIGMYVRLAFATAISVDPNILIVDEALAVGDEAFQRKCFVRIEQIQERGGTILFVSHATQTIVQLCSRAMLLDGGELLLAGEGPAPTHFALRHSRGLASPGTSSPGPTRTH